MAGFTLTFSGLLLAPARKLADELEAAADVMATSINETDELTSIWEVVAYFATRAEAELAYSAVESASGKIASLPEADWVRSSLEGLAPVTAGRFYLHGAHDRQRRRPCGVSIEIDAGTAFGTGHHGTTEGCLLALERIIRKYRPKRILDIGSGTGVLAIAAAKATGNQVLASDIDTEATRVTKANARANAIGKRLEVLTAAGLHHLRIRNGAPYDLIFANILARPLISLAQGLSQILAPNGMLILSGLTLDQRRWILATYRNRGLIKHSAIIRGNWATLVLVSQKKKRPEPIGTGRWSTGATGTGREEA